MSWGWLSRIFGTVAAPAPPEPIPKVVESEDAELELTREELAEAEFAEANWPFKELSAMLQKRYNAGEASPGTSEEGIRSREAADSRAFAAGKGERREASRLFKKLEPGAKVYQEANTPHADRLSEILRKVKEIKEPPAP